jgi:hypothetical protein
MWLLLDRPASDDLAHDQLLRVSRAVIASGGSSSSAALQSACLKALCGEPLAAAQHLSSEEVLQLLEAAVACNTMTSQCIELLCRLRAAAHISSQQLLQLLKAAINSGNSNSAGCIVSLCSNLAAAAAQLSSQHILQLREAAQRLVVATLGPPTHQRFAGSQPLHS